MNEDKFNEANDEAKFHLRMAGYHLRDMHEEFLIVRTLQADIAGSLGRLDRALLKMMGSPDGK